MMSINPKKITLTLIKLYETIQEEKGIEINDKFSHEDTINLIERIIMLFQEQEILSLYEIYSRLKNIPIKDIESNWRSVYAKKPFVRTIRKHLYFIEESRLIKIVQRRIESLEKLKQVDRTGIQFHWKYTFNRFENYLKKKNVEF